MTIPPSTHLVLVRHGEADCNAQGIVGGHRGCTGLSPLGVAQAEALRARWESSGEMREASAFYASVLPRAIETAEIIAPALGDLALTTDCDLCELHPGESDGMTWEEFAAVEALERLLGDVSKITSLDELVDSNVGDLEQTIVIAALLALPPRSA